MAGISFDEFVNGGNTKKGGSSSRGISVSEFVNTDFNKKKKPTIDFSQYDPDILDTLKQDSSAWTYDLFDAEDLQRKSLGIMPKSVESSYDLNDPIDKALYEGGYVSRKNFSKGYQQAEQNNAKKSNFAADIVKGVQAKLTSDPTKNEKDAYEGVFDELRDTDTYKGIVKADDKDAFFKRYVKDSMQSKIADAPDEITVNTSDLLSRTQGTGNALSSLGLPQAGKTYTAQRMEVPTQELPRVRELTEADYEAAKTAAEDTRKEEKGEILKRAAMYDDSSEARAKEIDKRIREINRTLNRTGGVQQTYINPEKRNALLEERNALQAEMSALHGERADIVAGRNASALAPFYKTTKAANFEQNSEYDPSRAHTEDVLYSFINRQEPVQTSMLNPVGINAPASTSDPDYAFKYLTDEERSIYNYLVNTGGDDKAFLEAVRPYANKRMREAVEAEAKMYAEDRPVLSSLETIVTSPVSAIEGLIGLGKIGINTIAGRDTDPNDPVFQNTRKNAAIRDTVSNTIKAENQGFVGEALAMIYQTGMSMGDTAIRLPMGAAGLGVAGLSAAASAMDDALTRGATSGQALASGVLNGAAEVVFEKVSLDNLVSMSRAGNLRDIVKNILKQGGVEASEEAFTEIANTISDAVIMADKSAYETSVREYIAQGMDEQTACQKASMDIFGQIVSAGIGGFLSGAGFGAGGSVNSVMRTAAIGRNINAEAQINQGRSMPEDTEAFKLANNLWGKGEASVLQAGQQFIANQEALAAGARTEFESNVRASGISEENTARAMYLYDRLAEGKNISPRAAKTFAKLKSAVETANTKRAEVEAELGVTRLEIKTKLEQTYAAMTDAIENGDINAFNKAKARYMAEYQVARAKTAAAEMKANNQSAEASRKAEDTVNEMVSEAAAEDMKAQTAAIDNAIKMEVANGIQNNPVPQRNEREQRTGIPAGNETARAAEPPARSERSAGRNQGTVARRGLESTPEAEEALAAHREVVKRATGADINTRIVNEVNETDAEMLDMIKSITGRDAFLYESDDSYGDGFVKDGQIFLRVNGSSHLAFLSGHEAAHADKRLVEAGLSVIRNMAKSEVDAYAEYRRVEVGEDGADIERELISDVFGRMMFEVATGHQAEKDFGVSKYTIDRFYDAFLQALSPDLETGSYIGEAAHAAAEVMNVGAVEYSRITFSDPEGYVDKQGNTLTYSAVAPEVHKFAAPEVHKRSFGADPEDHIDRRGADSYKKPGVLPFHVLHPQLQPYMQEMAAAFLDDLQNTQHGERYAVKDDEGYIVEWTGHKRQTTKELADLLDSGLTYTQIEEALLKIIDGENVEGAAVKRVEKALDDALTNGHISRTGEFNSDANLDYIAEKVQIPGALPNRHITAEEIAEIMAAFASEENTEYYAFVTKDGKRTKITGKSESEVIQRVLEERGQTDRYYVDVTIRGKKQRLTGNDKAALENKVADIKRRERMENLSRPVQILREANRLFRAGVGVEGYSELCGQTGREYDVAVARALMGIQLRNGQDVGGQLSTTHLNEILSDSDKWKDKGALAYGRETLVRNLEDIAPTATKGRELVRTYWELIDKGVADMTRWMRKWSETIGALKLDAEESAMVQLVGEGRVEGDVLKNGLLREDGTQMDASKIQNAVDTFREFYAEALRMANDALVRNGYAPVNARRNYFPHMDVVPGDWQSFVQDVVRGGVDALPTEISGMTDIFQPGKKWFRNFQERLGDETDYDAVRGFAQYVEGIGHVIFLTDGIQRIRQLEKAIRAKYGMGDGNEELEKTELTGKEKTQHLSRLAAWLLEYGNQLAGKKARVDRAIEDALGRKSLSFLQWMKRRFGANAVGGNLSTALSNFIPLTQGLATMKKSAFINGMRAAVSRQVRNDGLWKRSNFLTKRFGKPDALTVQHWKLGWPPKNIKIKGSIEAQKAAEKLNWLFELVDRFTAETLVFGKYEELVKQGIDSAEAMKRADEYAERTMAGRTIGSVPTLMNSKTLGFLTQFQLEINNQMSNIIKDMPRQYGDRKKFVFALLQLLIYGFLYNEINEKLLTGRRPAFDPINVLAEAVQDFVDPDVKAGDALMNAGINALDQLPLGQLLTGGGRIPLAGAIESVSPIDAIVKTFNGDDGAKDAWKEFGAGILYNFALPAGGGQLKKWVTGTKTLVKGGRYYGDQLAYPVEPTAGNIVSTVLFGPSAVKEGREFYAKDRTALSKKKTEAYQELIEAGMKPQEAYDGLQAYKGETNAEKLTSLAESDIAEKNRKLIAKAMGIDLESGSVKSQAKEAAKSYLENKKSQYKNDKISKEDLEEADRKTQALIKRLLDIN